MKNAVKMWLEEYYKVGSKSTRFGYESIARVHILNDSYGFGTYDVNEIRERHIKKFSESLPGNLAKSSQRTIVNTLSVFMSWAHKKGMITHLPKFPTVKMSNGDSYVYFVHSNNKIKIGYSTDIKNRMVAFNVALPDKATLLFLLKGGIELEAELHEKFKAHYSHGEWFNVDTEILAYIASNQHRCVKKSLGLK